MRTDLSVLYVEDDAAVRLGSTQSLQIAGLSVEAFGSAEQVLHRLFRAVKIGGEHAGKIGVFALRVHRHQRESRAVAAGVRRHHDQPVGYAAVE